MLKDTISCRQWGLNSGLLNLESDGLPLRVPAPSSKIMINMFLTRKGWIHMYFGPQAFI